MSDSGTPAFVHPAATVEADVVVGGGTRLWSQVHVRTGARIGEECNVGVGAFIDVGVQVGSRCKIQTHALLFEGAVVEDEVFIGPAACLTNDRFPRATTPDGALKGGDDWQLDGVRLRRGSSIGAHAVVVAGVEVGPWAMVGSGAVVTKDVPAYALMVGVPARRIGWVCRCGHPLDEHPDSAHLECPECHRAYVLGADGLTEAVR